MNQHPYLRAYMAGITIPTIFLLVIVTFFEIARYVYDIPILLERVIVFPMACVPNLWGLWNILYLRLGSGRRLSIGLHGAALILVLVPLGLALDISMHLVYFLRPTIIMIHLPLSIAVYYLAWKYFVGRFNQILGVA